VALSRLFLAKRSLWLLDEPTTALDSESVKVLATHVRNHLAQGGLLITAAHDNLLKLSGAVISMGTPTS
jgi:heme exporter protein A